MITQLFTAKKTKEITRLTALAEENNKRILEHEQLIDTLTVQQDALLLIKRALEGSSAAIMMIDRDFIVTYVNEASHRLFNDNAAEFKSAFPSFDPAKIMGTCIDVFHKKPEHQRQMLNNTAILPFKTDIKVANLTIALNVTATYSQSGKHSGHMLEWRDVSAVRRKTLEDLDALGQLAAINSTQGVIEIALDGTILKANAIYHNMLGYNENELQGRPVSMVLEAKFANSLEYKDLWQKLMNGGSDAGQYKRMAKNGKEVWIQASYNPINDVNGKTYKIVNYTIDITEQKLAAANHAGQIAAIGKIQGVVEFDLTGKVIAVNTNFADAVGYSEKEIVGNHHSMFVEPAYRNSHDYKMFWEKLARGEADEGQYKRIGKGGKEIWLQASYNPIMDLNGKPFKVVKYATDISLQHHNNLTLANAVNETQTIIEAAKAGDLSSRVSLEGKSGAIASLCDGVNVLLDKMSEVIIEVREAGVTINNAASEISSGNSDLSSRTEQQASSLEETAASMEELASTVKQNAENAKQANQLAVAASNVAIQGGEVVGQVVNTMSAINQSAHKIEDIISVIDGIAFQTNILALNAAVEAARAGEQGRGFAVVAGEVRNLAQRSATAAKEIKELIADSVSKTREGTVQVETAGKTMQEIVLSVQRVTDIMSEISAASSEQSIGISQVNDAITSMDEVTQQNAALVEQAAAAAESLVDQAVSLVDLVSAFELNYDYSRQTHNDTHQQLARRPAPSRPAVRLVVNKPLVKLTPKPALVKSITKISANKITTNQGDWEEF